MLYALKYRACNDVKRRFVREQKKKSRFYHGGQFLDIRAKKVSSVSWHELGRFTGEPFIGLALQGRSQYSRAKQTRNGKVCVW